MSAAHPFDAREFRNALGCHAAGVTIVTALRPDGVPMGLTVNSFASVSLDPPMVLWCIDRNSDRFSVFSRCPNYTVSVLDVAGLPIARQLAKKGSHLLDGIDVAPTKLGPPAIAAANAVFECEIHARHDAGDHVILLGQVLRFHYRKDPEGKSAGPLLYYRGRYGSAVDAAG